MSWQFFPGMSLEDYIDKKVNSRHFDHFQIKDSYWESVIQLIQLKLNEGKPLTKYEQRLTYIEFTEEEVRKRLEHQSGDDEIISEKDQKEIIEILRKPFLAYIKDVSNDMVRESLKRERTEALMELNPSEIPERNY